MAWNFMLFLLYFGLLLNIITLYGDQALKNTPGSVKVVVGVSALVLILVAVYLDLGSGKDIKTRLLVAFPGGLLSGVGLMMYSRTVRSFSRNVAINFILAGSFMVCYALLTGVIPSDVIVPLLDVKIVLFRGVSAFLVMFFTIRALSVFSLEQRELINELVLDGMADKAWDAAKAITVTVDELPYEPNNGYEGMRKTDVHIKSLYDDKYAYFLITYKDPTKSLARFPWVKQADGSWKKLSNKDSTGHDNTYYEDKLAMFWNISAKGFETDGCMIACHLNEPGDKSAGRKYTESAGETIDMWHAKYVCSMPMGMFDDQYVDNNTDPKKNSGWGRKGDTGKGGYKNNDNADKSAPAFMNLNPNDDDMYYVIPSKKVPFVDNFKEGAIIPGIDIAPMMGGRADILSRNHYEKGVWTLEVQRSLKTEGENADTQDVQFTDMSKSYPFGIAVFDNSQINHLFHVETLEMKFK